jgi:hypothetical membrane protein
VDSKTKRSELTTKWLAICGVIAVVIDVPFTIGMGALDPQYSHSRQYVSELGAVGRPYAAVFNTWCVVYGFLYAGFAVALGRVLNSRVVMIGLLLIAANSAVSGVFPCDPGCAGQTPAARVHMFNGYVGFAATIVAPLFAWTAMKERAAWRGYRALTLASVIALVVATAWLAACQFTGREHAGCPVGAAQRLVMGIQYVWITAMAVRVWLLVG